MRRGRLILLVCALVAVGVCLILVLEIQPRYHGRPLIDWLVLCSRETLPVDIEVHGPGYSKILIAGDQLSAASFSSSPEAIAAVRHIGPRALPWAMRWLRFERPAWRRRLDAVLAFLPRPLQPKQKVVWAKTAEATSRAEASLQVFRVLGPDAKSAIPELISLMDDEGHTPGVSERASTALFYIGHDAFLAAIAALQDRAHPNRTNVLELVRLMAKSGANASLAVPAIASCLGDADTDLARACAATLGILGLEPAVAVPALQRGLKDPRGEVSGTCAQALEWFEHDAQSK